MKRKKLVTISLILLTFSCFIDAGNPAVAEELSSEATVTFIDRSTVPNGNKGKLSGLQILPKEKKATVSHYPKTGEVATDVLFSIAGVELLLIFMLLVLNPKRSRVEEGSCNG